MEGKKEQEQKEVGQWSEGRKEMHSVKESEREKEREIKRWRKREGGGCYIKKDAGKYETEKTGEE